MFLRICHDLPSEEPTNGFEATVLQSFKAALVASDHSFQRPSTARLSLPTNDIQSVFEAVLPSLEAVKTNMKNYVQAMREQDGGIDAHLPFPRLHQHLADVVDTKSLSTN